MVKVNRIVPNVSWCWWILSIRAQCPIQVKQLILWGFFIWPLVFICSGKIYCLRCICGLRSPSLESSSVLYISPTDTSPIQTLILQGLQQKLQKSCSPVLDVIRTLGTSNQAIYYNLQNISFSSLIDLDTLTIMSPEIDAPYLWIRPLGLVPLNLA